MPRTGGCRSRACSPPPSATRATAIPATARLAHCDRGDGARARRAIPTPPRSSSPAAGRPARARRSGIPIWRGRWRPSAPPGAASSTRARWPREIARWARARGGLATAADFRAQRAEWGAPLSAVYRGVTLFETPPPTQGLSVLQMLRLARGVRRRRARVSRSRSRAPADPGQAARLPRPRPLPRRSALRGGAGVAAPLRRLYRGAPAAHRPRARLALGPGARRGEPGGRHGLRGGGGRGGQRGLAHHEPLRPLRRGGGGGADGHRAAESRRLLLARSRPSQSPRAGQAAAAHPDRVARLPRATGSGRSSAAWAPTASRRFTCRPIPR